MHNTIVEDLKRNEDKAKIGIQQMGDMAKRYEEMAARLKAKAAELENTADTKRTPWHLHHHSGLFGQGQCAAGTEETR